MHLLISIILSFLLALLAFLKKAMTNSAILCAFWFSCLITYYGGLLSFIILATVFISTVIIKKIKNNEREKINSNIIAKSKQKDILQIIANVGVGTFSILLFAFTANFIYLVVYASVMAETLADTLASDIGVLSKKEPINILTLKKGEKGLSGNISILGIISSCLGSFIIGLIFFMFHNIKYLIIITISGILGSLFDSILGATIQVKYKCSVCNKTVEQKNHCKKSTEYYKGIKIFNNDLVNFTSNIIAALISLILLFII